MNISEKLKNEIDQSGLFDEAWYVETYKDVAALGLCPFEHFLRFGLLMDRDPSPLFSTRFYKSEHPDVVNAGMIPLQHYIRHGKREGRACLPAPGIQHIVESGIPETSRLNHITARKYSEQEAADTLSQVLSTQLKGKPKKLFSSFDSSAEDSVVSAAARLYLADRKIFEDIKVSIVMPAFNRADRIGKAINSVLAQSHKNFELLIIDDGSTDNTKEVLERFSNDDRVRVFWNDHLGVSAARNTGLHNATGQYIFYLDSDNTWTVDFLAVMVVAFKTSGKACMYGASKLQNASDEVIGYRGEPFNWDQCVAGNYIDMNVFGHHVDSIEKYGAFDTTLERMVDWDLILRYTRDEGADYCPVIGCIYFEDGDDKGRITTTKPYIFRKIVHEKNKLGLATTAETFATLSLTFAIKIPAPYEVRDAWGDFHYADSLKNALEKMGHVVRIDFLEDWDKHPTNSTDITLVLRGLSQYIPKPSEFSILWNISHSDQISYEEYSAYKIICVASTSYAALLSTILGREVKALLQCTDSERFAYRPYENVPGKAGVFVGNSRNEYREIVKWAVDAGLDLDVYGQRWDKFLPKGMVKKDNVPNQELAKTYSSGQFVLNDHWASMKHFGIISNRVFDVVGCGGRLVSDGIASINDIFEGAVEVVDGPEQLKHTLSQALPPVSESCRRALSHNVHTNHSFDARAREIVSHIGEALLGPENNPVTSAMPSARRKRVGLLLQQGKAWPTSSAFIRLIAPLTTDYAQRNLEIVHLDGATDAQLQECDICIVQRVAVPDENDATFLLSRLKTLGIPLYIDTDDAFFFHEQHKKDDIVLQRLMHAAQETWLSTAELEKLYAHVPGSTRVLRNTLDPRFWRNYRKPVNTTFDGDVVRFVYMGTATHDSDFQEALPMFERLAKERPGSFELTIIGAVRKPPSQPWVKIIQPPKDKGSYPYFVRWLVENAAFDVGIAPLTDSAFNHAKSDIKSLDYAALGLLSLVSDCPAYRDQIDAGMAIGCHGNSWFETALAIVDDPKAFEAHRARALENVWTAKNTLDASEVLVDHLMKPYKV